MTTSPGSDARPLSREVVLDAAVGASVLALRAGTAMARASRRRVGATTRRLPRPRLPGGARSARAIHALAGVGADRRAELRRAVAAEVSRRLDIVVPVAVTEVLRRAGLTDLVLRYLDLDRLVASVDLDAAAGRLDVNGVLRNVDLDAAVTRVDLDRAASRLDVDAVVHRVDLDAVLDRVDLTELVLERVQLDAIVQAVLAKIDLIALAEEVIDGVDLPEIIRESTGSMASESVRGARMQGIAADEAVGRTMDRLLLRRGGRRGGTATGQVPAQPGPGS